MQEVCVFIINTNVFNYLQKNAPNSSTFVKNDNNGTKSSIKKYENVA